MASARWWAVYVLIICSISQTRSQAQRPITKFFNPPIQVGDVINITGTASARSVGLIRFHSGLGSCDTRRPDLRPRTSIMCNPLIIKLLTRKHKVMFFAKGMDENNRDVFIKAAEFPELIAGRPFTITVTVSYTGFDVRLNEGETTSLTTSGNVGKVIMIKATSGIYDGIVLKRRISIPLNEQNCGLRDASASRSKRARIINGLDADPGAFPWQTAIRKKKDSYRSPYPSRYPHVCGATLISSCWVLTAAHCASVVIRHKENFAIRVGDYHNGDGEDSHYRLDEDQQDFDIEDVYVHKLFDQIDFVPVNDIALIKLKKRNGKCARYSEYVNSACLPEPDSDSFPPLSECHISGWGAKNWTDRRGPRDYPHVLQYGKVLLRDFERCRSIYGKTNNITLIRDGMICAGSPGIDTCRGDSGGPLVCQRQRSNTRKEYPFVLWGVTSWGHGCADTVKPGVYAEVSKYIDWIKDVRASFL